MKVVSCRTPIFNDKVVPLYGLVFHCRGDFLRDLQFFRVLCTLSPAIIQLLLFGLLRLYGRICVAHHSSSCPISSVSCLAFPFQVFVFVLWFDRFCGCHPFSHHLPVSGDHLCTFGGTGYILMIFKLIRYSRSFQLIGRVLQMVKDELITACTACGILLGFSGILMYYIEHEAQPEAFANIGDGFWWAVVTFTTVGYGDVYPVTALGRLLSGVICMVGIAMIAIPTGLISSAFMSLIQEKKRKEEEEHKN